MKIAITEQEKQIGQYLNAAGAAVSLASVPGRTTAFVYSNGSLVGQVEGADVDTTLRNLAFIAKEVANG